MKIFAKQYLIKIFLLCALATATATSCPVCYGTTDTSAAQGMSAAILTLLGVTGGVMGGFVSLFLYFRKRAKLTLNGNVDPPSPN